mmetsp:Transcript_21289/g.29826  ORF Transcript_21289/g.29826 Transcript_21289/m.29826 type:complete len:99 (-) Transcript_21289:123-419(-)
MDKITVAWKHSREDKYEARTEQNYEGRKEEFRMRVQNKTKKLIILDESCRINGSLKKTKISKIFYKFFHQNERTLSNSDNIKGFMCVGVWGVPPLRVS